MFQLTIHPTFNSDYYLFEVKKKITFNDNK